MRSNHPVAGSFFEMFDHGGVYFQVTINDLFTLHADKVRVWLWSIAIVMVVVGEIDFHQLVHFLEQRQGLVHCCLAHGWKLVFHFFVKLKSAGVTFTGSDQANQFNALGGHAVIALFQRGDQFIKTE